jgi:hypothetical protein
MKTIPTSLGNGIVRSEWSDLKRLAEKKEAEVTVHVFGKMWP